MSSEAKGTVHARVQVTIEVDVPDVWGLDCALSQVKKQTIDKVTHLLRLGFVVHGLQAPSGQHSHTEARIIGDPKVTAILVEGK